MLDRPRHQQYIDVALQLGCRVTLIEDGDVLAALSCSKIIDQADIYYGIGGAPEGVITAAAISAVGGSFIARLVVNSTQQQDRLDSFSFDHKYLFSSEYYKGKKIITCLSGVTDGAILKGIEIENSEYICNSLLIDNSENSAEFHYFRSANKNS
jgi:fructose-1,6-bisphosphatase II